MSDEAQPVTLHILGKEYRVVCPYGEEEALLTAAQHLSSRMKEVKNSGKVIGIERVAVITALNITHELLQERRRREEVRDQSQRIQALKQKIEMALEECGES